MSPLLVYSLSLLWSHVFASKRHFLVDHPQGHLLCSVTYHKSGVCKMIKYDIKYLSCSSSGGKNYTGIPLSQSEPNEVVLRKVSMCHPGDKCSRRSASTFLCGSKRTSEVNDKTDIKTFHISRNSLLHEACEEGSLCMVQYLVTELKVDVNCRGPKQRTPIMAAVVNEQVAVFNFLLSQNCDLSLVGVDNENILHVACKTGNIDIVRILVINQTYDLEGMDIFGRTPVMKAGKHNHIKVVEFLIQKNCNLSAVDHYQNNILHITCMSGRVDMVKNILSKKIVSIESRGRYCRTPVMKAAANGYTELVKYLVGEGCDVTVVDHQKNNILHLACAGGQLDMVEYILTHKLVDIESRGFRGATTVILASSFGHRQVYDLLVKGGCIETAVDSYGDNSLHAACAQGEINMVKYILSRQAFHVDCRGYNGQTPVMKAAKTGYTKIVELLVSKACDLSITDDNHNTILHLACGAGHLQTVKYLITLDVVDQKQKNKDGMTQAQVAKSKGHLHIFTLFHKNDV